MWATRTAALAVPLAVSIVLVAQPVIEFDAYVWEQMSADPHVVAVGDLNGDGLLDAAVAVGEGGAPENEFQVRVYLQEAPGGLVFAAQYPFPGPREPLAIAIGDVDNDGLMDISLGYGDSVGVYHQNAGNTFEPIVGMYSGEEVDGLAIGDLNDDGLADIVSAHMYEAYIKVFLQVGGGFTEVMLPHPTAGRNELNIADLNGDGLNDVLLMPGQFSTALYLFTQNGSGALDPYVAVPTGFFGQLYKGTAIGDVDGDGLNDVVATLGGNIPNAHVNIWYQDSTTHVLENTTQLEVQDLPDVIETADLDCNGRLELLVMHSGHIACYQQDLNGDYGPYTTYPIPYSTQHEPQAFAVGDLDNDGRPDLIVATYQGVSFLKNRTMPEVLDSVVMEIFVDTTFTDTIAGQAYFIETVVDTSGLYVIQTASIYDEYYSIRRDSVHTDTLVVSYGMLCDRVVVDSLLITHAVLELDTLWSDTVLADVYVDTLLILGVGDRSIERAVAIFPNPTSGIVRIGSPLDAWTGPISYSVFDARGRRVKEGKVPQLPWELDLRGEQPGTYRVLIASTGHFRMGSIVLVE